MISLTNYNTSAPPNIPVKKHRSNTSDSRKIKVSSGKLLKVANDSQDHGSKKHLLAMPSSVKSFHNNGDES